LEYIFKSVIIRNTYKTTVGKSEENRIVGRSRHKWEDNTKMGLKYGIRVWTGFTLFRTGSSSRLLLT
jgi:hypothetical protein